MDTIYRQLETQPRTKEGVFWHKAVYPNQIWLDGMYMAQPFYMQYELSFHNRRACSDSFHMFQVVHDLMRNPLNGLYYHAYDASRKQFWCDPVTGLSANFWLRAEGVGGQILIEPGWNETVNTPDRCREVLERVPSPALGVIYDPVSLLHPSVVGEAQENAARMLYLCGSKIRVLHAKDFEVVDNEDEAGWCDGTGSRLVCHGVGETGRYDFEPVVAWAAAACSGIPCVVENSVPATAASCLATLERMSARCGAPHREI